MLALILVVTMLLVRCGIGVIVISSTEYCGGIIPQVLVETSNALVNNKTDFSITSDVLGLMNYSINFNMSGSIVFGLSACPFWDVPSLVVFRVTVNGYPIVDITQNISECTSFLSQPLYSSKLNTQIVYGGQDSSSWVGSFRGPYFFRLMYSFVGEQINPISSPPLILQHCDPNLFTQFNSSLGCPHYSWFSDAILNCGNGSCFIERIFKSACAGNTPKEVYSHIFQVPASCDWSQFSFSSKGDIMFVRMGNFNYSTSTDIEFSPSRTFVASNVSHIAVMVNGYSLSGHYLVSNTSGVIDKSWKCVPFFYPGWDEEDYDDSFWATPFMMSDNTTIGFFPFLSDVTLRFNIYCRKSFKQNVAVSEAPPYVGCFVENTTDPDLPVSYTMSVMNQQLCASLCLNYTYFGVSGNTCGCGNSFGKWGPSPELECNVSCSFNSSQICGGRQRNSIYLVPHTTSPAPYTNLCQTKSCDGQQIYLLNGSTFVNISHLNNVYLSIHYTNITFLSTIQFFQSQIDIDEHSTIIVIGDLIINNSTIFFSSTEVLTWSISQCLKIYNSTIKIGNISSNEMIINPGPCNEISNIALSTSDPCQQPSIKTQKSAAIFFTLSPTCSKGDEAWIYGTIGGCIFILMCLVGAVLACYRYKRVEDTFQLHITKIKTALSTNPTQ